ncbi:hypothetical protein LINGRAHAP2_LOCUS13943, partial [Linum grandiflorum]
MGGRVVPSTLMWFWLWTCCLVYVFCWFCSLLLSIEDGTVDVSCLVRVIA